MAEVETKRKKRSLSGVVLSASMDKSVVVQIEQLIRHKLYGKFMRRHVKYMADDPENTCKVGDKVLIEECRPLSKNKRWRLRTIIERAL
ncbi:MAG: 30S ribosomal protein S17 [Desulfobulbales bacterium]|nr:30S ribosomal protein S17 [Desulfobulbales bacterium]